MDVAAELDEYSEPFLEKDHATKRARIRDCQAARTPGGRSSFESGELTSYDHSSEPGQGLGLYLAQGQELDVAVRPGRIDADTPQWPDLVGKEGIAEVSDE